MADTPTLRIVDFTSYTDSTSRTYLVDVNSSYLQAFVDAEEAVLLTILPDDVDIDELPSIYNDPYFVKAMTYRVIVEYYRGSTINSVLTPSEPTTEIVNYADRYCQYMLNLSNLYLDKFGKKYPNAVRKQQILL